MCDTVLPDFAPFPMGNDLETEHLPKTALNDILDTRQQKPTKDNRADFYWITLFFFWMLFKK